MSDSVNLIFFGFGDSDPLVSELQAIYQSNDKFEIEKMSRADEVSQFVAATGNGIFFFKMTSKVDLQNAVGILKSRTAPLLVKIKKSAQRFCRPRGLQVQVPLPCLAGSHFFKHEPNVAAFLA